MFRGSRYAEDMTRMELLPTAAPVYGGGLIVAFLPEAYIIPERIRVFLVFQGSQQRHTTEAKISLEDNAFHAVIPDHEPPEQVEVSVYLHFSNGDVKCLAAESFKYFLDQTCYLARYLADSVHNLESLEDWDNIQGQGFSLEQEDFATLDERLASAFQHLILPPEWSILGDARTAHIPRETLFHFAARLGLSTFVTLLLEKNGAQQCLKLKNRYGELAEDIARQRQFDGLADLITDPHAHGVIRWESQEPIGKRTVLKRHSLGTISTSSEPCNNIWSPLEIEIDALCKASRPPDPVPFRLDDGVQAWEESMDDSTIIPGRSQSLDYNEAYDDEQQYMLPGAVFSPSYVSEYRGGPKLMEYPEKSRTSNDGKDAAAFLTDNLNHLREISDGIHHIRHRDVERLRENTDGDAARLSTSCPDLAQDAPGYLSETTLNDSYESPTTPIMPRNRRALPVGVNPAHFEEQLSATYTDVPDHLRTKSAFVSNTSEPQRDETERGSGEPSPTSLQRRHSWHSSEDLPDDSTSPSHLKRHSYQPDDEETGTEDTAVRSPPVVRRMDHNNKALFSVVVPTIAEEQGATEISESSRRPKSMIAGKVTPDDVVDAASGADRRFTISEGVVTDDGRENNEVANSGDQNGAAKQLSLTEFLSDPRNFTGKPSKPPPLPPKPDFGPAAKRLVTRKLSFLNRVRNSARTKTKEKGKAKFDLRFGNDVVLPEEEPYDATDAGRESAFSKNKLKRPSIIQRPQSMMINRPAQYPVANPVHSYTGSSRNGSDRTIMAAGTLLTINQTNEQPNSNRSSYHDEDDYGKLTAHTHLSSNKDFPSGSVESLNEAPDFSELEKDPDLAIKSDEPEAWSVTVDKKVLKKMSKKDIKRQDNIFEFIQTERNHLTNLKIMQKIFAQGLLKEVHLDSSTVDKLFPLIDEHVEFVSQFVHTLIERQANQKTVERIGDILTSQWEKELGETMKRLLGDFCSKHNEITSVYKDLLKNDKKFQIFIAKCDKNPLTRRREITHCALLVTQRITKYPVMVQAILDNSNKKEHKEEYENLSRALELSKEIAKDVDEQVQAQQRQQLLYDVHERTEAKSSTQYKDGRRFDRKDLLKRNRKLLYSSSTAQLKIPKKFAETQLLLLSDCIVFLQESGGKYSFISGLPAVLPLQNLLVREVANNDKGLYLLSPSSKQMYEMKTQTSEECKMLTRKVRVAVGNCPDDEDEGISEDEEERRLQEIDRAHLELILQLEEKDKKINELLTQKMSVFKQLAESVDRTGSLPANNFAYPLYSSEEDLSVDSSKRGIPSGAPFLTKALEQITKLSSAMYGAGGLSRHPSSVGEHETGTRSTPSLPKRSDTFGGFDNGKEPPSPRSKYLNSSQSDSRLRELEHSDTTASESTKRDSGLDDFDVAVPRTDSHTSINKQWDRAGSASPGSSPSTDVEFPLLSPTTDQVTALNQLSHLFNSYLSVAAQQHTQIAKLQLQLNQTQDRGLTKKRAGTLQEAELKRNQLKQQEQMDDLRREQQQFKTEREQFKRQNERIQRSLEKEKSEIEDEKKKMLRSKHEIQDQWEVLHKQREDYQRDLARLREQQRKTQHDMHSSTSASSISSLGNKNSNNNTPDYVTTKAASEGIGKAGMTSTKSHSSLHPSSGDTRPQVSPTYASASEYPHTFPGPKREPSSAPNLLPHAELPIHLKYSATNQLASMKDPTHQQLPLQIAQSQKKTGSGSSGKHNPLISSKLSKLASLQSGTSTSESSKNKLFLRHNKRSSNSDLHTLHLQVPATSHRPIHHERSSSALSVTNSVSPSQLSDSSVERSNSSASSKDGDKPGMRFFLDGKTKHDREETMELFF